MEVFILGICREIFFFFFFSEKRGQKLGSVLYMGAHYTRVNTVFVSLVNRDYVCTRLWPDKVRLAKF